MEEHRVFICHSSKDELIAQLICHRLEDANIKCWIAPRNIDTSDWAGAIMKGLAISDVCVIIVSANSIYSGEVTKEISEATRTCSYIIPFKVDWTELTPNMQYHLGPCHWLDASTPPIELHVEKLKNRILQLSDADKVYVNKKKLNLVEHMVWPKNLFLGREEELDEIYKSLEKNPILFIQGMGGIGKTEIVKAYAKKYRSSYDTIIFMVYQDSIQELIIGDDIQIENFAPWNTECESTEQFFERKINTIQKLVSKRTLLILDNFDMDEDDYFERLVNLDCHLLVTTRNEYCYYPTMKIGPISNFEIVRDLFIFCAGIKPTENEILIIDEILQLVKCHTITVELLACQMKVSHIKPAELLKLVKSDGINTKLREKVKRDKFGNSDSAFGFIRKMFVFSELSESCKNLMRYMTMVPCTGMDIRMFFDVCQLDSYDDLNKLIAHSWLMLDENTNILSMHPIIADVVREELNPTTKNCQVYIKGICRTIGNLWLKNQKQRAIEWTYYEFILKHYPEPIIELWSEYGNMENNAWICGRYSLAIESGIRYLNFTRNKLCDDVKLGLSARLLGGCYYNSGDLSNAEIYYEMALELQRSSIREESDMQDWIELAISYQKVGRCAYLRKDFEKSKKYLESSLEILRSRCESAGQVGGTLIELERMYIAMGDYQTALKYCKQSLTVFMENHTECTPDCAFCYLDFGKCYMALDKFDEAEESLNKALEIDVQYHGEDNYHTFKVKENLADLLIAKELYEDALQMYIVLESQAEQNLGETNAYVIELKKKIYSTEHQLGQRIHN